jgi:hypothetical protein
MAALNHNVTLEKLKISTENNFTQINDLLSNLDFKNHTLTSLDLSDTNVDLSSDTNFIKGIMENRNLKELIIPSIIIGKNGLELMSTYLKDSNIEILSLGDHSLVNVFESFFEFLKFNRNLSSLRIGNSI